jgi:hypothetical protein
MLSNRLTITANRNLKIFNKVRELEDLVKFMLMSINRAEYRKVKLMILMETKTLKVMRKVREQKNFNDPSQTQSS